MVGIVGHEAAKFTPETEAAAKKIIRDLLTPEDAVLVSGGCHLGGIDIWAEEIADELGREKVIFRPEALRWGAPGGYRERNEAIARTSDVVYCIVVKKLPEDFRGRRHTVCYHCGTTTHVKSGGCWTAKKAAQGRWYEV